MVTATRPLLYLSIPGLALIIGFIFFRRQKRSKEDGENCSNTNSNVNDNKIVKFNDNGGNVDDIITNNKKIEKTLSINLNKNSIKIVKSNDNDDVDDSIEFETKFGKSAPINITYGNNNKILSVTKYMTDDDNSNDFIIENDDSYLSSVNLSDSPDKKNRLIMIKNNRMMKYDDEEPIIVKANVSPIISLSNSFIENKYTENDGNTNNINNNNQLLLKKENNSNNNKITSNNNDYVKSSSSNDNLSSPASEFSIHSSGDSGKGSSLPQSDIIKIINYDFILPSYLIGQLCGRKRSYINQIKSKSGVNIILKNYNITMNKIKICSLKGTEKEINIALSLIRSRFPLKRYPELTLQKIEYAEPQTVVQLPLDYTSCLQLRLIEGINNDVIVVSIISGNHIFVHHPSHPSYRSISILQNFINESYETGNAPSLPQLTDNAICVAKFSDLWYRIQIITTDHKEQKCLIKFLDYGGYTVIGIEQLKQIRADFMTMPFQATECLLSNIEPIGTEWSQEAIETLCHLTAGLVLQAQIVRYNNDVNLPEVNLYVSLGKNSIIFINKEMVARGFAKWTSNSE